MEAPVAGIDVSKDKLIMYFLGKLYEFTNDKRGYEEIRKILPRVAKWVLRVLEFTTLT